jgi:YHS domain-containing protein
MYKILTGLALLLILPLAIAGKPAVFSTNEGAIRGYDPVAYFTVGMPTRGSDQFTASWQGATYRFASADNLARFKEDPATYAPQYGGYCAYAVSKGATATTVPEAWTIVDGKLYLNYSLGIKQRWSGDIPGNINAADSNWPAVLDR